MDLILFFYQKNMSSHCIACLEMVTFSLKLLDVGDSLDPVSALAKVKAKNVKKKILISKYFLLTTVSSIWSYHWLVIG